MKKHKNGLLDGICFDDDEITIKNCTTYAEAKQCRDGFHERER